MFLRTFNSAVLWEELWQLFLKKKQQKKHTQPESSCTNHVKTTFLLMHSRYTICTPTRNTWIQKNNQKIIITTEGKSHLYPRHSAVAAEAWPERCCRTYACSSDRTRHCELACHEWWTGLRTHAPDQLECSTAAEVGGPRWPSRPGTAGTRSALKMQRHVRYLVSNAKLTMKVIPGWSKIHHSVNQSDTHHFTLEVRELVLWHLTPSQMSRSYWGNIPSDHKPDPTGQGRMSYYSWKLSWLVTWYFTPSQMLCQLSPLNNCGIFMIYWM